MRIWPFATLWARRRAERRIRAMDAFWMAEERRQVAERRRIVEQILDQQRPDGQR